MNYLLSLHPWNRKKITFDSFIRNIIWGAVAVGIIMLLNYLSGVLLPFFLAWLIAYLLFPLVKFFQYRCHLKYRIVGILCTFLLVGAALTGLFLLMIPPMIEEGARVKDLLIAYVSHDEFMSNIPSMIDDFIHDHFTTEDIKAIVTQEGFIDNVKQTIPKVWNVVAQSFSVLSSVLTLTMVLLYTLFILLDYEQFSNGWVLMLPERWRPIATQVVSDVEQGMNKYFRGQGCVAFCVGVLFSIGFLIIGFPMAIGLGMFIGLLNMVLPAVAGFHPHHYPGYRQGCRYGRQFLDYHAVCTHRLRGGTTYSGHYPHAEDHG